MQTWNWNNKLAAMMNTLTSSYYIRLFYHALLLMLLFVKIMDWNYMNSKYSRSLRRSFGFYFLPPFAANDGVYTTTSMVSKQIFNVEELWSSVGLLVERYNHVQNYSVANLQFGHRMDSSSSATCSDNPGPINLEVLYWDNDFHLHTKVLPIAPANVTEVADRFANSNQTYLSLYHIDTLRFKFDLCNYDRVYGDYSSECNYWHIKVTYKSVSQMYFETFVDSQLQRSCTEQDSFSSSVSELVTYIDILLIIFSVLYLVLIGKDIYHSVYIYQDMKKAHHIARQQYLYPQFICSNNHSNVLNSLSQENEHPHTSTERTRQESTNSVTLSKILQNIQDKGAAPNPPQSGAKSISAPINPSSLSSPVSVQYSWAEIPLSVKRKLLPHWAIITCLGVVFVLMESVESILLSEDRYLNLSHLDKALLGGSSFLLWMGSLQFLSPFPPLYAFVTSLQTSLPRLCTFFIGFLPIFIGFVVVGQEVFGASLGMFRKISAASWGLFSLMNGDSVQPLLILMTQEYYALGLVYSICFIFYFSYLMINLLIAIIEESYFLSRKRGRVLELVMWTSLNFPTSPPQGEKNEKEEKEAVAEEEEDGDQSEGEDSEGEGEGNIKNEERVMTLVATNMSGLCDPNYVSSDPLFITSAEEMAEVYILGKSHFQYSKLMDYLSEHLCKD